MSHWALENLPAGWVNHGERMMALLEERRPARCVEVGTYKGASAIATARVIAQWGGRLTCVDTWANGPVGPPDMLDECLANFRSTGVDAAIDIIVGRSVEVARTRLGSLIDFLYIDAEHTYPTTSADIEAWWPHVRIGGVMAGDDYLRPEFPGCTAAWDDFDRQVGGLQREGLVWVEKLAQVPYRASPFVDAGGLTMRETTCASCHRVVWAAHVDGEGRCVFCALPPARSSVVARPAPEQSRAPRLVQGEQGK